MAGLELTRFVETHSLKSWEPGSVDCLLTLADWFRWRGFPDAAAHLRGTYTTEEGFCALLSRYGGAVAIVDECAARIAINRVDHAEIGSIGIIGSATNSSRQFGGIYDGAKWLLRADKGFLPIIAKPIAVWDTD